jgi:SpoVK/Ycf46/Vps4 family AAA+-type ATPase
MVGILLMDQLELILPKRGDSRTSEGSDERIVTSFLTEMDGLFSDSSKACVFIVGVTSFLENIDPAILRPGRIDIHVGIKNPDSSSRMEILKNIIKPMPNCLSDEEIENLVVITDGFNSSSLVDICREAAMVCIRKNIETLTINQFKCYISDRSI